MYAYKLVLFYSDDENTMDQEEDAWEQREVVDGEEGDWEEVDGEEVVGEEVDGEDADEWEEKKAVLHKKSVSDPL